MSDENVFDFYDALGFEETDIEDDLTALSLEVDSAGSYVLITDSDGAIPQTLKQAVILACYTPAGAFQWNAGFKNSYVFKDIWSKYPTPEQKLDAIQKHRASLDE